MHDNENLSEAGTDNNPEDWVDKTIRRAHDIERLLAGLEPVSIKIAVAILFFVGLFVVVAQALGKKIGL